MNIAAFAKGLRLKFKEKCATRCWRQSARLPMMLSRAPLQSVKNGIIKVMINVTYRCDCGCDYCWCREYAKVPEREFSTSELKKAIAEIAQYPSLSTLVSFVGGEPLLRNDIYEAVAYAVKRGLFTEMESDGFLLSEAAAERLKASGLHHMFVRLEGACAETHDAVSRLRGCFDKAVAAIRHCLKAGFSCSIFMNATKEKIRSGEVAKIIGLGKELGAASVRIIFPTLAGGLLARKDMLLTEAEAASVRKLLEPGFVYLESSDHGGRKKERYCAALRRKFFHISCYGEVQPCPFVPVTFGNVRERPLKEILERMFVHPMFSAGYAGCLMNNPDFRRTYIEPAQLGSSYRNIAF